MEKLRDIQDDEIRVIGGKSSKKGRVIGLVIAGLIVLVVVLGFVFTSGESDKAPQPVKTETSEPGLFEGEVVAEPAPVKDERKPFGMQVDSLAAGFCEIRDTMINDIPLKLYIPHNASMSLHIGKMDIKDENVIYTAQAADIRADNKKIVGAFVLAGEPKAWGLSKRGYCASIDGKVTIGVADNSPLFEEAAAKGGHFFRQYPLVDNGRLVENNPKNKAIRRAICERMDEIFMIETLSKESFHDFAQALVDLGVENGVYLVGGEAYGWARDAEGVFHDFGVPGYYGGYKGLPRNTNYIVWRKK